MKINDKIKTKAAYLLSAGHSFAIYRLPDHAPKLVTASGKHDFYITPWRCRFADSICIDDSASGTPAPLPDATPRDLYLERVAALIEKLKGRGMAKTVISRVIAGRTPGLDVIDAAERLWNAFPATFGFLYYTPATGCWLGASPEKLLVTFEPDHFTTHALAGTVGVEDEWDVKNYQEHQMVADYIADKLRDMNVKFSDGGMKSLRFGNIKHLSTHFNGRFTNPSVQAVELLDRLSPTPALAGWPCKEAIDDINDIEDHNRGCYGGYLTVNTGRASYSYVNLRCAAIDPVTGRWAVFAGGGITPKSDPATEWRETEAKAAVILEILNNRHTD